MNYNDIKQIKMSSPKYKIVSCKTKATGFKDLVPGDVIYFISTINRVRSDNAHSTYVSVVCDEKNIKDSKPQLVLFNILSNSVELEEIF